MPVRTRPTHTRPARSRLARTRPTRTRPVRLTLVGLLVIPLVSLTALWGFAANITLSNAITEQHFTTTDNTLATDVGDINFVISQERTESYVWLSTGRGAPTGPLDAARRATDAAVATARRAVSLRGLLPATAVPELSDYLAQLGRLGSIRAAIDSGRMSASAAFQAYSNINDAQWHFFLTVPQTADPVLDQDTLGTIDVARAAELADGEAALVAGALAAHGQMSTANRELFASSVSSQRLLVGDALALMGPGPTKAFLRTYNSPVHQRFADLENQIVASVVSRGPIPVNRATWQAVSTSFLTLMGKAQLAARVPLAQLSSQDNDRLVTEAALAGGVGLAAVVASIFLMVWFGRRLATALRGLRDSANIVAYERLPGVVERLGRGEEVDVDAESPPPAPGKITEIARVAQAFAAVQRTAVQAAVGQASLRKGVSQVFLSLSLRNQSLLHRQLGMLDSMERATQEPQALADLFRLDHLTTRMRRHAEGLIILSGATPGRGWREPVPVLDVLRAAIAEVEDYTRVEAISESRDTVAGTAVNDVIHLIAELIENATTFSPPNTPVEVRGDRVGSGFAVEIEDRGLGLTRDELAEINERLGSSPEFDLANSDQLGLFVVGRLAARHQIKVSLRQSPFGGTTAIVLLPHSIIVREGEKAPQLTPASRQPVASGASNGSHPAQVTDAIEHRERASAFSLAGRNRPGPQEIGPSPAGPAPGARPGGATWFDPPADRRAKAAPPRAMPPAQDSRDRARPDPGPGGTHRGLPIRVRQASIAPQLRADSQPDPAAAPRPADANAARSPEQTRSMMNSLQQGWQRGRSDELDGLGGDLNDEAGDGRGSGPGRNHGGAV
jgi:signal transduction histidine kinase